MNEEVLGGEGEKRAPYLRLQFVCVALQLVANSETFISCVILEKCLIFLILHFSFIIKN